MRAWGKILMAVAIAAAPVAAAPSDEATRAVRAVLDAERAFSDEVDRIGVMAAFRQNVGPDAIMFLPEPVIINTRLDTENWQGTVDWRPELVLASAEGDVVATAGPSSWQSGQNAYPGYYFTVWKKQPDGTFRFVLDGSADLATDLFNAPHGAMTIRVSNAAGPPDDRDPEGSFIALAATDAGAAYDRWLDADARVLRASRPPSIGRADASGPSAVAYEQQGHGASETGGVFWAWGVATWTQDGSPKRGSYARVWRRTPAGWAIMLDNLAPIAPRA